MKTSSKILAGFLVVVFLLVSSLAFFAVRREPGVYGRIAVVGVSGIIHESRPVIEELRGHDENPSVRAIVIRIDSPGGGVAASQEIYAEINRIREEGKKPVVASLGGVAASGGYYIACGAEKIIANPGTLTGSVGAVISAVNMEELLKKLGLEYSVIKSGRFKDAGSAVRELSPEEEELLQGLVDDIHEQFLEVVRERRGLDGEQLRVVGDSRVFTGAQALELSLVDRTGTFYEAVEEAARLAGLERWRLLEKRRRRSLRDFILGLLSAGGVEAPVALYMMQGAR